MKYLVLSIVLILSGCNLTPERQVIVDIGARNAVAQFIQAADDPRVRAIRIDGAINKIEKALTVGMDPADFIKLVEIEINSRNLSAADRLLVEDIWSIAKSSVDIPNIKPGRTYEIAQNFIKQARFATSLFK